MLSHIATCLVSATCLLNMIKHSLTIEKLGRRKHVLKTVNSSLKNFLSHWDRAGAREDFAGPALILTFSQREKGHFQQAVNAATSDRNARTVSAGASTV